MMNKNVITAGTLMSLIRKDEFGFYVNIQTLNKKGRPEKYYLKFTSNFKNFKLGDKVSGSFRYSYAKRYSNRNLIKIKYLNYLISKKNRWKIPEALK